MKKKILIILGHPDPDSLCGMLAACYREGAVESEAEIRQINIGDLDFDPVLHKGYKEVQALEPDLRAAQEAIRWADHLVFLYPMWWGSMPAVMKGFIDRVFIPGFGFKFSTGEAYLPEQLLTGKSARLIITLDGPPLAIRLLFGNPAIQSMKGMTLEFCGIHPVRVMQCGSVKRATKARKILWKMQVREMGRAQN